jgi:hypothetical protein
MQVFESDIRLTCPKCESDISTSIPVPEPNWGEAEELSDLHSDDISHFACPKCNFEHEAMVTFSHGECSVKLTEFPETCVDAQPAFFSPPEEEDWLFNDISDEPYVYFAATHEALSKLLGETDEVLGNGIVNRMIFAQHVSAMEAYLADALIRAISGNATAIANLLKDERELKKLKFSLDQINEEPNLVVNEVIKYLKGLIFHNLTKIDRIYQMAFNIRILEDSDDNQLLLEAIKYRHDCVHRNGQTKEGETLNVFTDEYVSKVGSSIANIVERIDKKLFPANYDTPF